MRLPMPLLFALLCFACSERDVPVEVEAGGAAVPGTGTAQPNIVVWLVDTLRADHLSAYGYPRPTSPRLEALAAGGVLFSEAHVHSNWTIPSVSSLYSGRYPPVYGADFATAVPSDLTQAAEWYSAHGYGTAGFTITLATAAAFGFDRGYDLYRELDAEASDRARRDREGPAFDADVVVDAALDWLDGAADVPAGDAADVAPGTAGRDPTRPFFLTLHTVDPHVPYEPHPEGAGLLRPYDGTIDGRSATLEGFMARGERPTEADLAHVIDLYDNEVRFNDAQLGRLVDGLQQRGLLDDTLLVVVSDHGEELWDRHAHGHGHRNLHAELTRVPLVLHWPAGLPAGLRVTGLVRGIDLLPTLLELCGLPPLPGVDGESLAAELRAGQDLADRGATLYARRAKELLDVMALRTDALLYHADPAGRVTGLYDLTRDPGARRDLRADNPGLDQGPRKHLFEWLDSLGRRAAGQVTTPVQLDEADLQALRALGYLGDDG